jgi:hypothetical protein
VRSGERSATATTEVRIISDEETAIMRLICGIAGSIVASMTMLAGMQESGAQPGPERAAGAGIRDSVDVLLDRLMQRPGQLQVMQCSSHNKTGHNGDENWPLYKDQHGDDVIFDAAGPGCIRSIWGTHFDENAVLNFYFDGETEPRYRIGEIDFFKGNHPAFPPPLVSYEHRGEYALGFAGNCFMPIAFEKSLKISISGESRFFHIIYELYPHGTPIETFTGRENRAALVGLFDRLREAPTFGAECEIVRVDTGQNDPGASVVLLKRDDGPGIVRGISIEADGSDLFFRDSEFIMRWDGHVHADVRAPAGMFFASANHACDVATLPVSVKKLDGGRVRLMCRFPMPFWREAEIIWRNGSAHPLGPLQAELAVSENEIAPDLGAYFTTRYRQGKTSYGRDWRLLQQPGAGWFVGVVQSMQHGHYCEGDEHFYFDGAISPQFNGTGSEDYYLGCFWPNVPFNSPFACCAGDIMAEGGGHFFGAYRIPSSYGRFHLEAPIPFFRSIDARIQHGGLSRLRSDYRSLAFCYLRRRPVLRQTDFIDVGNRAAESAHDYRATHSRLTGRITACPEGEHFQTAIEEDGRTHAEGEITFTVAIDPDNAGVRLRRRLDQASPRQTAEVYIDGAFAGTWYHACHNEHLRWFDSDFDIPSALTHGKDSLAVRLVVDASGSRGPFTEFRYEVFSFEPDGGP